MSKRIPARWGEKIRARVRKYHRAVKNPEAFARWMWSEFLPPAARSRIRLQENPRVYASTLARAVDLYERFHGKTARRARTVNVPDPTRAVVRLGELVQVNYAVKKRGDRSKTEYYHRFKSPRPVLYSDPEGKNLFVAGGDFEITELGIEG